MTIKGIRFTIPWSMLVIFAAGSSELRTPRTKNESHDRAGPKCQHLRLRPVTSDWRLVGGWFCEHECKVYDHHNKRIGFWNTYHERISMKNYYGLSTTYVVTSSTSLKLDIKVVSFQHANHNKRVAAIFDLVA